MPTTENPVALPLSRCSCLWQTRPLQMPTSAVVLGKDCSTQRLENKRELYFHYEMFAGKSKHLEAWVLSEVIPNAQWRELNKKTARFILSAPQQANKTCCMLRISSSRKLHECASQKSAKMWPRDVNQVTRLYEREMERMGRSLPKSKEKRVRCTRVSEHFDNVECFLLGTGFAPPIVILFPYNAILLGE